MIHRYHYRQNIYMDGCKGSMIGNMKDGEYVKYEDVKHLISDTKKTIHKSDYIKPESLNRKEIEAWLYDSDYLFKEATKDIQTICGTKQYHVELLEAFQSALLKEPSTVYMQLCKTCTYRNTCESAGEQCCDYKKA